MRGVLGNSKVSLQLFVLGSFQHAVTLYEQNSPSFSPLLLVIHIS
jgi:hypothetical protein